MSESNKRERRKKATPLIKFFKKLKKECATHQNFNKWEKLVKELTKLIQKNTEVIPISTFQSYLNDAKTITDRSTSGIKKACVLLQKHLRKELEKYLEETIEEADGGGPDDGHFDPPKPPKPPIIPIAGGGGAAAVAIGVTVLLLAGQFDFNFDASDTYGEVFPGGSTSFPFSVFLENGNSELVYLNCYTNSDDVSCKLDLSSVLPSTDVQLTVNTTSNIRPSNNLYAITVVGDAGSLHREKTFNLKVNPIPEDPQLKISKTKPTNTHFASLPITLQVQIIENPPVADATVKFYLNNKFWTSTTSDANGYASTTIQQLSPGDYTWYATSEKSGYKSQTLPTQSFTLDDTKKPTISILAPPHGSTISTKNIRISGTANDIGSGIDKVEVKIGNSQYVKAQGTTSWYIDIILNEGINTISAKATDRKGLSGTRSITITVDTTGPSVIGQPNRPFDSNGWYNSQVIINWMSESTSNSPCSSTTYSGPDTTETNLSGSCTDNVGNVGTGSYTIKYDSTKPTVSATPNKNPNSNGWYNSPVTVNWSGNDSMSGINTSTCSSKSYSGPDTTETNLSGSCTDYAGNTASKSYTIKYDSTKPTVSATSNKNPNSNGWYNSPVTVNWSGSDNASGINTSTCSSITYSGPDPIGKMNGSCIDYAGNEASSSYSIKYDAIPPQTSIVSVVGPNNESYSNGATISTSYITFNFGFIEKPGSGFQKYQCSLNNSPLFTCYNGYVLEFVAGEHTMKVQAVDVAGNEDLSPASFSWTFKGIE